MVKNFLKALSTQFDLKMCCKCRKVVLLVFFLFVCLFIFFLECPLNHFKFLTFYSTNFASVFPVPFK